MGTTEGGESRGKAQMDKFTELRRRVMRRCVYALNTLALKDDRLPRDGAFDAAAANALAAIVAHRSRGAEYRPKSDQVKSPLTLIGIVARKKVRTKAVSKAHIATLKAGIEHAQAVRHGRADEEWDLLRSEHVDSLIALDKHPTLNVLDALDGKNFDDAITLLYWLETEKHYPADPCDRMQMPEPDYCDECGRRTLVSDEFDAWGINLGEGVCIACGRERTYDDTVSDHLRWKFGDLNGSE